MQANTAKKANRIRWVGRQTTRCERAKCLQCLNSQLQIMAARVPSHLATFKSIPSAVIFQISAAKKPQSFRSAKCSKIFSCESITFKRWLSQFKAASSACKKPHKTQPVIILEHYHTNLKHFSLEVTNKTLFIQS